MNAVKVLPYLNKLFSTKVKTRVFSLTLFRGNSYNKKLTTSLSLKSRVQDDVTLFHFENPRFFLILNTVSVIQCGFWTYLGIFLFRDFKEFTLKIEGEEIWEKLLQLEKKYGDLLSAVAIILGWSMLVGTLFYSVRSIRKIILHKGGNYVTIVTYNLPGRDILKVPLNNISSFEHRTKAKKYIPLKIKDKYFYYLIDNKGTFSDPILFDFTAGVKRKFSKK